MEWLFETNVYVPRSQCGEWPTWMVVLFVTSNIIIGLSYFAIPTIILWLYKRSKTNIPRSWMMPFFACFIFFCGTTHIVDAIIFKWPIYRVLLISEIMTAIISTITAILLPKVVLYVSKLKSVEELSAALKSTEEERDKRKEMESNVREANHRLANEVQRLMNIIATQGWISQKQMDLDSMKKVIIDLRKEYSQRVSVNS